MSTRELCEYHQCGPWTALTIFLLTWSTFLAVSAGMHWDAPCATPVAGWSVVGGTLGWIVIGSTAVGTAIAPKVSWSPCVHIVTLYAWIRSVVAAGTCRRQTIVFYRRTKMKLPATISTLLTLIVVVWFLCGIAWVMPLKPGEKRGEFARGGRCAPALLWPAWITVGTGA